jgi:protein-L-isoaspartate(D-aspartate) O-methyltransferase
MSNNEAQALSQALVAQLKQRGDLVDSRLEKAFLSIPRHLFLPDLPLDKVYADEALPIKRDTDGSVLSSSSQPAMMALMLQQLQLRPGDNVLEIGTGTGYNAAIMNYLVGDEGNVTSVEIDKGVAQAARDNLLRAAVPDVRVVQADGAGGYAPRASYDRIIATVGIWDVPEAWVQQLKPKGILVAPIWLDAIQLSAAFGVEPDGTLYSDNNHPCGFVRLRGIAAGPSVHVRVGSSSLTLATNDIEKLDGAALHSLLSEDSEVANIGVPLSASDYWHGFMPYLMLNEPESFTFAVYAIGGSHQAYGIDGHGFALIGPGSACFVPYQGHGEAHCFASADGYFALRDVVHAWDKAGRPGRDRLRLRLIPMTQPPPAVRSGKLYLRSDHYLHAWMHGV